MESDRCRTARSLMGDYVQPRDRETNLKPPSSPLSWCIDKIGVGNL